MIAAVVHVAEYIAMVRGSAPSGATIGGIDRIDGAANARAQPKIKAMTNSGHTAVGFERA